MSEIIEKAIQEEKQKTEELKKSYEDKIKNLNKENKKKLGEVKKQAEEKAKEAEEKAQVKVESLTADNQKLTEELQRAKKEARSSNASEDLVKLKLIFNDLQSTANLLIETFENVKKTNPDTAEKLSSAFRKYLTATAEKL